MCAMTAVATVAAMSAVHEHMQQGAGEQDQPGKPAKHVGAVLSDKKEGADRQKGNRHETRLRSPEAGPCPLGRLAGWISRCGRNVTMRHVLAQGFGPSLRLEGGW